MKFQDPRNLESFTSMWNRATAKPFVPEQYPGYREIWPELATKTTVSAIVPAATAQMKNEEFP